MGSQELAIDGRSTHPASTRLTETICWVELTALETIADRSRSLRARLPDAAWRGPGPQPDLSRQALSKALDYVVGPESAAYDVTTTTASVRGRIVTGFAFSCLSKIHPLGAI